MCVHSLGSSLAARHISVQSIVFVCSCWPSIQSNTSLLHHCLQCGRVKNYNRRICLHPQTQNGLWHAKNFDIDTIRRRTECNYFISRPGASLQFAHCRVFIVLHTAVNDAVGVFFAAYSVLQYIFNFVSLVAHLPPFRDNNFVWFIAH